MLVNGTTDSTILLYQYYAVLYPTLKFLYTYLCLWIKDLKINVYECRILSIAIIALWW